MYSYSTLIYGFDFSDYDVPEIGLSLNEEILKHLEDCDLLKDHYSGLSNPMYIGTNIGSIDPASKNCDAVKIVYDAEKKVSDNRQKFNNIIIETIDSILEELKSPDIIELGYNQFTNEDVTEAIEYFNLLKTVEPTIKTLIATS